MTLIIMLYIVGILQLGVGGLWGFGRGGVGHELGLPINGWCFPYWRPGDGHLISIIILEPD